MGRQVEQEVIMKQWVPKGDINTQWTYIKLYFDKFVWEWYLSHWKTLNTTTKRPLKF